MLNVWNSWVSRKGGFLGRIIDFYLFRTFSLDCIENNYYIKTKLIFYWLILNKNKNIFLLFLKVMIKINFHSTNVFKANDTSTMYRRAIKPLISKKNFSFMVRIENSFFLKYTLIFEESMKIFISCFAFYLFFFFTIRRMIKKVKY